MWEMKERTTPQQTSRLLVVLKQVTGHKTLRDIRWSW